MELDNLRKHVEYISINITRICIFTAFIFWPSYWSFRWLFQNQIIMISQTVILIYHFPCRCVKQISCIFSFWHLIKPYNHCLAFWGTRLKLLSHITLITLFTETVKKKKSEIQVPFFNWHRFAGAIGGILSCLYFVLSSRKHLTGILVELSLQLFRQLL